jgi:hypothetical protein
MKQQKYIVHVCFDGLLYIDVLEENREQENDSSGIQLDAPHLNAQTYTRQ